MQPIAKPTKALRSRSHPNVGVKAEIRPQ